MNYILVYNTSSGTQNVDLDQPDIDDRYTTIESDCHQLKDIDPEYMAWLKN